MLKGADQDPSSKKGPALVGRGGFNAVRQEEEVNG